MRELHTYKLVISIGYIVMEKTMLPMILTPVLQRQLSRPVPSCIETSRLITIYHSLYRVENMSINVYVLLFCISGMYMYPRIFVEDTVLPYSITPVSLATGAPLAHGQTFIPV